MAAATAGTTIQQLRQLFAQFGIPQSIVSDNSPQFAAVEFENFCKLNGIHHIRVAPYHPSSNGLAERVVKIVKQGLKKQSEGTLSDQIARTLFQYRNTPHTTTGSTPAELLLGRKPRTRLDLLRPDLDHRVQSKQARQQLDHDKHTRLRHFSEGEKVFVKNQRPGGNPWLPGEIIEITGPVSYRVQLSDGTARRTHQDYLRKRSCEVDQCESEQSETAEDSDSWVDVGEVDSSSVTPPVPVSGTPHEVSHDPSSSTTTVETSPATSVC